MAAPETDPAPSLFIYHLEKYEAENAQKIKARRAQKAAMQAQAQKTAERSSTVLKSYSQKFSPKRKKDTWIQTIKNWFK